MASKLMMWPPRMLFLAGEEQDARGTQVAAKSYECINLIEPMKMKEECPFFMTGNYNKSQDRAKSSYQRFHKVPSLLDLSVPNFGEKKGYQI